MLKWDYLKEALDAYRAAGEQRPDDCKAPYGAGIALYRLGRLDETEEAYRRALQLCPRYAAALADLSTMRLDQQRYEEALDLSSTATDLEPGNATAWTTTAVWLSCIWAGGRRRCRALIGRLPSTRIGRPRRDARALILQESAGP